MYVSIIGIFVIQSVKCVTESQKETSGYQSSCQTDNWERTILSEDVNTITDIAAAGQRSSEAFCTTGWCLAKSLWVRNRPAI